MRIPLLVVLVCCASIAVAQTYKWRDASGRIQYTDTPPPADAKDVQTLQKVRPSAPTTASQPTPSTAEREAEFRKRLAEREESKAKAEKVEEEERMRSRNCEQAKGQLAALQSGGRMVRFNEAGERIALDEEERQRSLTEAQRSVDTWCNTKGGAR